jgi:hypothetical protein
VLGAQATQAPKKNMQASGNTYTEPSPYPTVRDWQPTNPPAPRDVSAFLNRMGNLFTKIAELNGEAQNATAMMGVARGSLEPCSRETWSAATLPNGEPNPSYVFDPHVVDNLYQDCLDANAEIVNMWAPDTEAIKGQIDSYHSQIVDIKEECNDSQCNDFYWEFVNEWQANGWYVR